ncbi:MAG: hypothetical protein KAQ64_03640 [Candidatus Pacebacteria bacterium]|nr:hypothetical protein [Candidatus Paceibacterota bacterium]
MNEADFLPDNDRDVSSVEDTKAEDNSEQLEKLLKDCFFNSQEEFTHMDLKELAILEKENRFKRNDWTRGDETERCNLMKKLETHLLEKNEEERVKFWGANKDEYRDYYGRSEEKNSKQSFETLKHGILNEIIANEILKKLPEFKFKMTTSEIDIDYKIDIIGFSNDNKIVLAIQVKQGSKFKQEKIQTVQEINKPQEDNKEKNDFFDGCSRLKDELNFNSKDVVLKNLWITIPAREKIGEGGKCSYDLQDIVIEDIKETLEEENK